MRDCCSMADVPQSAQIKNSLSARARRKFQTLPGYTEGEGLLAALCKRSSLHSGQIIKRTRVLNSKRDSLLPRVRMISSRPGEIEMT